jgi:hypothetical protein
VKDNQQEACFCPLRRVFCRNYKKVRRSILTFTITFLRNRYAVLRTGAVRDTRSSRTVLGTPRLRANAVTFNDFPREAGFHPDLDPDRGWNGTCALTYVKRIDPLLITRFT